MMNLLFIYNYVFNLSVISINKISIKDSFNTDLRSAWVVFTSLVTSLTTMTLDNASFLRC